MNHICHDPDCHDPHCDGHHHAHEGPEHTGVFAEQRSFACAKPITRAALEAAAQDAFGLIAARFCIDGILPGHAKALIEADGGSLALSLTCADGPDVTPVDRWTEIDVLTAFVVTLNVHVIGAGVIDGDALFAPFAAL